MARSLKSHVGLESAWQLNHCKPVASISAKVAFPPAQPPYCLNDSISKCKNPLHSYSSDLAQLVHLSLRSRVVVSISSLINVPSLHFRLGELYSNSPSFIEALQRI